MQDIALSMQRGTANDVRWMEDDYLAVAAGQRHETGSVPIELRTRQLVRRLLLPASDGNRTRAHLPLWKTEL